MTAKFTGDENICNFANEIRNHLKSRNNGKEETDNQLRRDSRESSEARTSGRGHLRGRNEQPSRNRKETQRIAKHIDALAEKLGTLARTTVYHSLDEVGDRGLSLFTS